MIKIRPFEEHDASVLWDLFYHTIRFVNRRDYSQEQVEAWAPDNLDPQIWRNKMSSLSPYIAEIDNVIVGYADLQPDGLVDHFFCHCRYQGQGVGRALMEHVLEVGRTRGIKSFYSEVSLTARPFYQHMGFEVETQQLIHVRGHSLTNFVMRKSD